MLDLSKTPRDLIDPIRRVVETVLPHAPGLDAHGVMVVGAWCRDIMQQVLSHDFTTAATPDLDLALALASWTAYRDVSAAMPQSGDTGIRFRIAGMSVDLLPFGAIEDPDGIVAPSTRDQTMSVWAFDEIFGASLPPTLSSELTIRQWRATPQPSSAPGSIARNGANPRMLPI